MGCHAVETLESTRIDGVARVVNWGTPIVQTATFLDEFRPFRRGEIALCRRLVHTPDFLSAGDQGILRHALRTAQLSALDGGESDALLDRIGSFRLRLLQLLAPVLPTDPRQIDAEALRTRIPSVIRLVDAARRRIVESQLASEEQLDAEIASRRLALVLGGAAGSGYVFLGALQRLEQMGIVPDYMSGCSIGALVAIIRARTRRLDLDTLFAELRRIRKVGVFRAPDRLPRFGLPAALRLDLQTALGPHFCEGERAISLGELAIAVDILATGLGPGSLSAPREELAQLVDADLRNAASLPELSGGALSRVISTSVSLAMSRRVLVPLYLGADPRTAEIGALAAAGFSAAIPGLLQFDLAPEQPGREVLDELFRAHDLMGIVDGALSSLIPARFAWQSIEAGRIGTRNCTIVALDAIAAPRGANAFLAPLLKAISATAERDRAFWDVHAVFKRCPPFLDLFPTESRLKRATRQGAEEFESTAVLLRSLLAPTPRWKDLAPSPQLTSGTRR